IPPTTSDLPSGANARVTLLREVSRSSPDRSGFRAESVRWRAVLDPLLRSAYRGRLAYLDAAGQELTQQFEIIDHADFLVLLLDHNSTATTSVSIERKNKEAVNVDHLVSKIRQRQKKGKPV